MTVKREVVAILGAGRLARAMARALCAEGGVRVVIAARRAGAALRLAKEVRGARAAPFGQAVSTATVVLLAVPDRSIAPLARAIAPLRPSWRGVVALHGAGAYGPELLGALATRGAATGVLHPLAVLDAGRAPLPSGAYARIEGRPPAARTARRLAKRVGLIPLSSQGFETPRARRAYHAAASLASNDVVALLAASHRLLVRHGVPARHALRAVVSLAGGALLSVGRGGLSFALTGPVVRNDAGTLRGQMQALTAHDRQARDAHRALSSILADLAAASGRLDRKDAAALKRRLARGRGRSPRV